MTTFSHSPTSSRVMAACGGLAAGALGLGFAQGLAAVLHASPSPLIALGDRFIDLTPRPLKEWAVEQFGTADKTVLLGNMLVVTALLLAAVGIAARRHRLLGVAGFVVLGVVDALALLGGRGGADPSAYVALVAGLALGCAALWWLIGQAGMAPVAEAEAPPGFDRRRFLLLATVMGGAGVVAGAGLPRLVPAATGRGGVVLPRAADPAGPLPRGVDFRLPGLTPHLTPNDDFYRIDIALISPRLNVDDWKLRVRGLVDEPLELSYRDLLAMPLVERRVTIACVSNPVAGEYIGNATWLGVRVADVLERAGVRAGADAVQSRGADGITIGTPLAALTDGRDALLAIGINGQPLPIDHGFPVRMIVPGLYGYVSATKWITELEVTRFADFSAYWTDRGWAPQGPIKTGCRIDLPGDDVTAGDVTVAGVAWAQHRGIGKVEVRVDDGAWQVAELATADGIDTWRQWRWTWPAAPGTHRLQARATDLAGATQTSAVADVAPDGATGYPTIHVRVG
ncbi:molybdopterin-dependent oxidoreductase [Nocardioides jiangxiensis]|uniref:Molybdopterin-dependent oxidoreductase n=1 Tax=Nocardioides jiangxiensis TaxID=3064524 RepID=A0ABT9B4X0_9ACTN|nr:molybdopterin-dependent oxidoreductase [Nocardioides sp. WY-20]MDO7868351.1 molybdopterin-dependent oxidoreductase [Nocardioides sp. WY-20]